MIVRIRFPEGRPVSKTPGKNRQLALAGNAVLLPTALMAYALGVWRIAADLTLTRPFPLTGVFSHWQVWIPLGAGLHIAARRLMLYGSLGTDVPPQSPPPSLKTVQNSQEDKPPPSTKTFRHRA